MSDWGTKMEMINRLLEEIAANSFEVGSWLWVDVLHVNSPHSFYVRPRTYSQYLPYLQNRGEHPDISEINMDNIFVFKSKKLKCNVRGRVTACNPSLDNVSYKMFAVDIGFTEDDVPLNKIWKTLYPLQVPPLVTQCQLAECEPRGETWDNDAIEAMRSYVEGERAKMIIRSKTLEKVTVEMYNSRPDDVATLLALTNHTSFGCSEIAPSACASQQLSTRFYATRELRVGEILHVRMLYGSLMNQFYVTPVEEYELYLTDRDNYTCYARSQNDVVIEELQLEEPVGVFYHNTYKVERGLVKELMPESNRAKIQLVDIGIKIEESITKMKPMPDWYLRVPMRAMWCTLHNSQAYTYTEASMSFADSEFQMTIFRVGQDNVVPNIVLVRPLKPC